MYLIVLIPPLLSNPINLVALISITMGFIFSQLEVYTNYKLENY